MSSIGDPGLKISDDGVGQFSFGGHILGVALIFYGEEKRRFFRLAGHDHCTTVAAFERGGFGIELETTLDCF